MIPLVLSKLLTQSVVTTMQNEMASLPPMLHRNHLGILDIGTLPS